jgi:hypothetical protein
MDDCQLALSAPVQDTVTQVLEEFKQDWPDEANELKP